jgi:hypothetical protein
LKTWPHLHRPVGIVLLLLIVGGWLLPRANAYCVYGDKFDKSEPHYDPKYYSAAHEFRRSKHVVEGRAVREVWLGDDAKEKPLEPPFQFGGRRPWGLDPYMGAYYTIEVVRVFKGNPPDFVKLFSENTTARFWLNVGDEYILFITEREFSDPDTGAPIGMQLTTDNCGNSRPLQGADKLLRSLEHLSHVQ